MFQGIDPALFPVLKTRRALVVVDAQNDFLLTDGALPINLPDVLTERIVRLVKSFRSFGDVVWIRSEYSEPRLAKSEQIITSDAPAESSRVVSTGRGRKKSASSGLEPPSICPEAFLSGPAPNRPECVRKNTSGAELPPAIQDLVDKKDIVIVKSYYSGFHDENLIQRLRKKFVSEVFVCGSLSNMGIMATAIDAGSHGLDIGIIEDCCGYRDRARHNAALNRIQKLIGCEILSTDMIIERLIPKPKVQPVAAPIPNPRGRRYPTVYEATSSGTSEQTGTQQTVTSTTSSKLDYSASTDTPADEAESDLPPIVFTRARVAVKGRPSRPLPDVQTLSEQLGSAGGMQISPNDDLNSESGDKARNEGPSKASSAAQQLNAASSETNENPPERVQGIVDSPSSSNENEVESALRKLNLEDDQERRLPHENPGTPRTSPGSLEKAAEPVKAANDPSYSYLARIPSVDVREEVLRPEDNITMAHSVEGTESEPLCEGDTKVFYNVLSPPFSDDVFEKTRHEVDWKRMSHQGGEVPRLVAVQGEVDADGNIPVYRHPADESPPLHPWTPIVSKIKDVVEGKVGHPLNHALIQYYRDGNDYISEHSDKTLDIAKGSFIVNVSLGAERTMILRTKRQPKQKESDQPEAAAEGTRRDVQRAPLPHNSMCQMGLQTNMRWLHAIRQDKRLDRDKTPEELAYGGARISLTFRQIATFLDKDQKMIWGQGAKAKTKSEAHEVVNGQSTEAVEMIKAFGRQNQSTEFDWDKYYGNGFDVLHISAAPRLFTSSDAVANMRVQFMLAELAVGYAKGSSASVSTVRNTSSERLHSGDPPIKLIDTDEGKPTILGDLAIMLYLDKYYGKHDHDVSTKPELALALTRFQEAFILSSTRLTLQHTSVQRYLDPWEAYARETEFIAGASIGLADFAFWPVLYDIIEGSWGSKLSSYPRLKAYFTRIRSRETIIKVLGKDKEIDGQGCLDDAVRKHDQEARPMMRPPPSKLVAEDFHELLGIKSPEMTRNKPAAKRGLDSE